jgi:hypothetical protein
MATEFFCYTRSTEMPSASQVVRFGLFEVDLTEGTLLKNGRKIKLQDQPFRLLVMLLEQRGETVTCERLKEALWSGIRSSISITVSTRRWPSSDRLWTTQPRIPGLSQFRRGEDIALSRRLNLLLGHSRSHRRAKRQLRDARDCRLREGQRW